MSVEWELRVYDQKKLVYATELTGPAVLGRQKSETETLFWHGRVNGPQRVVIAPKDDTTISRSHVLVEPQAGGFRITNQSESRSIGLPDNQVLKAQASCVLVGEVLLTLGRRTIRLRHAAAVDQSLQGLAEPTAPPGTMARSVSAISLLSASPTTAGIDPKVALGWLQEAMDMLQCATSPAEFFTSAAKAVIELGNLDSGRVLLWQQDEWRSHAFAVAPSVPSGTEGSFSRTVLSRVRQEKRTFWQAPGSILPDAESMREIEAVVAAPILDRNRTVLGALYGERRLHGPTPGRPLTELDAMVMEVLARGVAAGMARMEQEKTALAERVRFEQFFTPELARQLERHPDLLKGRDSEVSLLFCDIRGFSRISERLGPARTFEWIGAVMAALSDCVRDHAGVLVDYIGDELIAMWGAPEEQPDHARLACRAALDMLGKLPLLNESWQKTLQEPMDLGIGINSGIARVGNTGSHHKFKYGPLGNTVNLASRVQGATKHLKCRCLITGATQVRLDDAFATRRLCQVQVVNIVEPVTLFELAPVGRPDWTEARQVYEQALTEFEAKNFASAARALGNWRLQRPDDDPALLLLYRAVRCMVEGPAATHPVWVLGEK